MIRRLLGALMALMFLGADAHAAPAEGWPPEAPAELQTVAERSGFRATSTHAQVVELMDRIATTGGRAARLTMGRTHEGREIPLLVLADPPVRSAADARRAREQGKLVVLLLGNIHGGEVDAKEALLMLARELATAEEAPLLRDLVVAIAPLYNADGNERFGPIEERRPGQHGPAEGAGQRHNAQDLDLNRDLVKLEAPETLALVRFLREWDPALVLDGHTTNGSPHRFLMTFAGPKVPAGDSGVIAYAYGRMFPALAEALKRRAGIDAFLYGTFADGHAQWTTFPAQPRYLTNYVGLRNRLSLLSESYAYASYEDRVRGSLELARQALRFAAEHKEEIRRLIDEADERAARGPEAGEVALRTEAAPLDERGVILGFENDDPAAAVREYEAEVMDKWRATHSVARPYAYLVPASHEKVRDNLRRHGVAVEALREAIELRVTAYTIDEAASADDPSEGHRLVRVEATPAPATRRLEAGTIVVRTAQPLGSLAAYLLEPEAEDGLTAWGFFDTDLQSGATFPVLRLEEERPLPTAPVAPPEE